MTQLEVRALITSPRGSSRRPAMTAHQLNRTTAWGPEDHSNGRVPEWMFRGPCNDSPDLFFSTNSDEIEQAKRICASCPVRVECLVYANVNGVEFGVWGGTSEYDRQVQASGGEKTCKDCASTKPLTQFHKATTTRDRHEIYCKPCASVRRAARAATTKKRPRAAVRSWRRVTVSELDDARIRRGRGETVTAIAADLGVSRTALSQLLAGSRHPVPEPVPELEEVS